MIRVLVVDDHEVVRQGLRFLLEQEADIDVVAECADGAQALEAVSRTRPDVVLLDLYLPGRNGIEVLGALKEPGRPPVEVIVLTSSHEDEHLLAAVRAGAVSYLSKTAGVDQVVESVRAAARGESALGPGVATRLLREMREGPGRRSLLDELTPREVEVLGAVARGRSNKQIARELFISEDTVKTHVSSILGKLRLTDRTQAAIFGLQQRLVPLDEALEPGDGGPDPPERGA